MYTNAPIVQKEAEGQHCFSWKLLNQAVPLTQQITLVLGKRLFIEK